MPGRQSLSGDRQRDAIVADPRQPPGEAGTGPTMPPDRYSSLRYRSTRLIDQGGDLRPLHSIEEEIIRFALEFYGGHVSEAAKRLGIGRSTLYRKLRSYGIGEGATGSSAGGE